MKKTARRKKLYRPVTERRKAWPMAIAPEKSGVGRDPKAFFFQKQPQKPGVLQCLPVQIRDAVADQRQNKACNSNDQIQIQHALHRADAAAQKRIKRPDDRDAAQSRKTAGNHSGHKHESREKQQKRAMQVGPMVCSTISPASCSTLPDISGSGKFAGRPANSSAFRR